MTTDKSFKARVRAMMVETGLGYTECRRALLAGGTPASVGDVDVWGQRLCAHLVSGLCELSEWLPQEFGDRACPEAVEAGYPISIVEGFRCDIWPAVYDATKLASFAFGADWTPEDRDQALASPSDCAALLARYAEARGPDHEAGFAAVLGNPSHRMKGWCWEKSSNVVRMLMAIADRATGLGASEGTAQRVRDLCGASTQVFAAMADVEWDAEHAKRASEGRARGQTVIDAYRRGLPVHAIDAELAKRDAARRNLCDLFGAADDDADHHVMYVTYDNQVRLEPLGSRSPVEVGAQPTVKVRFETFGVGNGYVGRKAARDEAYVNEWLRTIEQVIDTGFEGYWDGL